MVDRKTVEHVAKLAHLRLSQDEVVEFSKTLSSVLQHFDQIATIRIEGVHPLVTPIEIEQALRSDSAAQSVDTEALLNGAAERSGRLFKVPPVV